MFKVYKLGYAHFFTNNVEPMIDYYSNVMGFTLVERGDDGKAYLSSGLDHHNIIITQSNERSLKGIGLQFDESYSVQEVAKELKGHGINAELKTDAQPGISELLEFHDPDGYIVHLYSKMQTPAPGFKSYGIVPNKLGHIALCVKDSKKVVEFYRQVLGFMVTDWIEDIANFLTCNTEHHVLNIVSAKRTRMHHIAFELRGSQHQYGSSDILSRHNIPVLWGPSRHTAGHNIATYHHDPDQHLIELFTEMDVFIPELGYMEPRPWHQELPMKPKKWEGLSSWGTSFDYDLANLD